MKRVYISGKITGLEEKVYRKNFSEAENRLKVLGYYPVNPAKRGEIPGYKWEDYMKDSIKILCDCEYIYMIPGWEDSNGAKMEHQIAVRLKIPVLSVMG